MPEMVENDRPDEVVSRRQAVAALAAVAVPAIWDRARSWDGRPSSHHKVWS